MEFITVEQFKEQPKEIQEVFLKWWKPSIGDIYCDIDAYTEKDMRVAFSKDLIEVLEEDKKYNYFIPIFTEGQLRKFIEDKTGQITFTNITCGGDRFIEIENEEYHSYRREKIMDNNLLQAYWKYSCRVAAEV